jgi:predicted DsbA family dithiol-disulfide isomerase
MNVTYIIVIIPLILFSDYVCNVCVMGEALLCDMMKIRLTELVE